MDKNKIGILAVTAVVIAGSAFYAGLTYAKNKIPNGRTAGSNFQNFQNLTAEQRQQMMQNGSTIFRGQTSGRGSDSGFASGEIISQDEQSITVKMQDNNTKIVFLSENTSIGKTTGGTKNDLRVGEQVVINGSANSDGSVTAQNIQIRQNLPNLPN